MCLLCHIVQKIWMSSVSYKRTLVWWMIDLATPNCKGLSLRCLRVGMSGCFPSLSAQTQLVCKSLGAELLRAIFPFVEGMVWLRKWSEEFIKDELNFQKIKTWDVSSRYQNSLKVVQVIPMCSHHENHRCRCTGTCWLVRSEEGRKFEA